jgi:hypothetical protein
VIYILIQSKIVCFLMLRYFSAWRVTLILTVIKWKLQWSNWRLDIINSMNICDTSLLIWILNDVLWLFNFMSERLLIFTVFYEIWFFYIWNWFMILNRNRISLFIMRWGLFVIEAISIFNNLCNLLTNHMNCILSLVI